MDKEGMGGINGGVRSWFKVLVGLAIICAIRGDFAAIGTEAIGTSATDRYQ